MYVCFVHFDHLNKRKPCYYYIIFVNKTCSVKTSVPNSSVGKGASLGVPFVFNLFDITFSERAYEDRRFIMLF